MSHDHSPLEGPPPSEVLLTTPPLVRVIAQVRFPMVASIERQDFIAPFQEAVRGDYPVLRQEQSRSLVLGAEGMHTRAGVAWRFLDPASDWRVTLAPEFVALETGRYSSRADFLGRLRSVLDALEAHIDPTVIDRLGVRYIDRLSGPNLADLSALVRPEVSGILATSLIDRTRQTLVQSVFELVDGGLVTARWGLVPANGTVDPAAIEAIGEPSWLLDLDAFESFPTPQPMDIDAIINQARGFAERIYSIFRWAVTDEFLRRHGGQP